MHAEGQLVGKEVCANRSRGADGHAVEHAVVPLQKRWPTASWAALGRVLQVVGSDLSPLFSAGENTHVVVYQILGSHIYERRGHMGASLANE